MACEPVARAQHVRHQQLGQNLPEMTLSSRVEVLGVETFTACRAPVAATNFWLAQSMLLSTLLAALAWHAAAMSASSFIRVQPAGR